jgi:hypothetical protein
VPGNLERPLLESLIESGLEAVSAVFAQGIYLVCPVVLSVLRDMLISISLSS